MEALELQPGHYLPAIGAKQKAPGRKVAPATHLSAAFGTKELAGFGFLEVSRDPRAGGFQCLA